MFTYPPETDPARASWTYSMTIPARRGFVVGLVFLWTAFRCLFTRDRSITIETGMDFESVVISSDP